MRNYYIAAAIFAALFIGLPPLSSKAQELRYGKVLRASDTQILVQFNSLEKSQNYLCSVETLSCTSLGSTTPKTVLDSFPPATNPAKDKLSEIDDYVENGATRLILSPDEKFYAYYLPAKVSNKTIKTKSERKHVLLDLSATPPKRYELKAKVGYWDLLSEELKLFDFSASSSVFAYLDDKDGPSTLYFVDLKNLGAKKKPLPGERLTNKSYSISDFLLWDDNTLYFVANRTNSYLWSLYRYDLTTKNLEKIADNISYSQTMKKVGVNLLFLQIKNNSVVPALYNTSTKKISYFTGLGPNQISTLKGEVVTLGGISGVLLKPANYSASKKYPLLVWLHGGPYRQAALGYHPYLSYGVYDWLLEEAARSGALVLKLDYRGSYGFGRTYAESIKGNVGKGDVQDVMKAVEAAKKKYPINKVYLQGNSYGGYLALRTLVEKPTLFGGAFSINGVTDWGTLLNHLDSSIFNVHFGGIVDEINELDFSRAAIVNKLDRVGKEKIVIAQASADATVPASQADLISHYILKTKKLPNTSIVKYPGEDHVFAKRASLEDLCRRTLVMMNIKISGHCIFK